MLVPITSILFLITFLNYTEVKKTSDGKSSLLWTLPILLILTSAIPIIIVLFGLFAIYRELVGVILKIKYGNQFVGFLNGPDAFQMTGNPKQRIISCFMMHRCPKTMPYETYYQNMQDFTHLIRKIPKAMTLFKRSFGYAFMIKVDFDFGDHFKQMKILGKNEDILSKSELVSLLDEHINLDMPKDVMWELVVGSQRVNWKDDGYHYYPTILRYHHAMADGVTGMKIVVCGLSSTTGQGNISYKDSSKSKSRRIMDILKAILENVLAFLVLPAWHVSNFVLKSKDKNALRGPKLSNQNYNVFKLEDCPIFVRKIKKIKERIPGVSFTDVLLTAISDSLDKFMQQKTRLENSTPIEKITTIIPVLMGSTELLTTTNVKLEDIDMTNNFSIFMQDFPLRLQNKTDQLDIINRLTTITRQTNLLKTSFQLLSSRLVVTTAYALFPQELLELTSESISCTGVFSFLPGTPKIVCCNDMATVCNIAGVIPHANNTGVTIFIYTYDDRLQICVSVDKALVGRYEDVEKIAHNIFKNFELMEEAALKYRVRD